MKCQCVLAEKCLFNINLQSKLAVWLAVENWTYIYIWCINVVWRWDSIYLGQNHSGMIIWKKKKSLQAHLHLNQSSVCYFLINIRTGLASAVSQTTGCTPAISEVLCSAPAKPCGHHEWVLVALRLLLPEPGNGDCTCTLQSAALSQGFLAARARPGGGHHCPKWLWGLCWTQQQLRAVPSSHQETSSTQVLLCPHTWGLLGLHLQNSGSPNFTLFYFSPETPVWHIQSLGRTLGFYITTPD